MSSKLSLIFQEVLSAYMKTVATKYGISLKELQELAVPGYDSQVTQQARIMEDYSKMTVSELKKVCATLGIKKQSTKAKLLEAIQEYHQSTTSSASPVENVRLVNPAPIIADEDVLIIQDKKKQAGIIFTTGDEIEDNASEMSSSFDDSFILDDDDDDDVADLMDGL
jgi:signal recognition particle subunit SEC65